MKVGEGWLYLRGERMIIWGLSAIAATDLDIEIPIIFEMLYIYDVSALTYEIGFLFIEREFAKA